MKALISPNEIFNYSWISSWNQNPQTQKWDPVYSEILNCQRVAQVEPDNQTFPVAEPLYWFNCPDNCQADAWYFKDNQVSVKPQDVPSPATPQPQTSNGDSPGVIA
jgi:hypothetical protein